ncbi:hypothetical protein BDV96DRAFT_564356 [Lophiotrema nucula]|uniref:Uncharacterized protein n=1 Tax=Lophiotrema nucula TaxID=690887 RepID=A0A6A5ZP91_9PLEO|nr:hypothetical protein BDV96DRAFT_564356 [Lophiotrema nucula]
MKEYHKLSSSNASWKKSLLSFYFMFLSANGFHHNFTGPNLKLILQEPHLELQSHCCGVSLPGCSPKYSSKTGNGRIGLRLGHAVVLLVWP